MKIKQCRGCGKQKTQLRRFGDKYFCQVCWKSLVVPAVNKKLAEKTTQEKADKLRALGEKLRSGIRGMAYKKTLAEYEKIRGE